MSASRIRLTQGSAPSSNPPTATHELFVGSDGHLKRLDESGAIKDYDATSALTSVADTNSVGL